MGLTTRVMLDTQIFARGGHNTGWILIDKTTKGNPPASRGLSEMLGDTNMVDFFKNRVREIVQDSILDIGAFRVPDGAAIALNIPPNQTPKVVSARLNTDNYRFAAILVWERE